MILSIFRSLWITECKSSPKERGENGGGGREEKKRKKGKGREQGKRGGEGGGEEKMMKEEFSQTTKRLRSRDCHRLREGMKKAHDEIQNAMEIVVISVIGQSVN